MNKGSKILFLFFVLLFIIISGYFYFKKSAFSPKTDSVQVQKEKTNSALLEEYQWKIFKNEKYGYQIKYPADWYLLEPVGYPDNILFSTSSDRTWHFNSDKRWANVSIQILDISGQQLSPEEWMRELEPLAQENIVNNRNWFIQKEIIEGTGEAAYSKFSSGKIITVSINLRGSDGQSEELRKIFHEMLESLTF